MKKMCFNTIQSVQSYQLQSLLILEDKLRFWLGPGSLWASSFCHPLPFPCPSEILIFYKESLGRQVWEDMSDSELGLSFHKETRAAIGNLSTIWH